MKNRNVYNYFLLVFFLLLFFKVLLSIEKLDVVYKTSGLQGFGSRYSSLMATSLFFTQFFLSQVSRWYIAWVGPSDAWAKWYEDSKFDLSALPLHTFQSNKILRLQCPFGHPIRHPPRSVRRETNCDCTTHHAPRPKPRHYHGIHYRHSSYNEGCVVDVKPI